ncbi:YeeE/YedE family protein [Bradyrhizobium diazoefficiens]|uniref:YeeE/YedE family protein n=1 Tax=Bradyrhizobium diazoefficiens TaxID=1355477 RepID=UPI00190A2AAA|nr:YeeE/YedE family protein [Bradyrhizobium diazoefficiens]QQO17820.1 YeeE/YedE family protein [Bradyrhizobium diazoefficiens]
MTDLSIDARLLAPDNDRHRANLTVVTIAAAILLVGAVALSGTIAWHQGLLFLLGGALGLTLYHALFGFTSAWRVFIVARRGAGLRAQMVMLALATALFFPALAQGTLFGQAVHGELGAVGVGMLTGAFLFGLGMQLGGGCASGTLYTAGGGNTRMLVTLAAFIAGSTLGALHLPWWSALPNIGAVSLIERFGWLPALLLGWIVMAAVYLTTVRAEIGRHGTLEPGARTKLRGARRFMQGPWPLLWGAILLAIGNFATLYLAGRPWGITSAFALWGSKVLMGLGVDVASWPYWQGARAASLHQSIFADITSVMDFGIMLGALLAAGLAGKFQPSWQISARSLLAAIVGGLLLGYGARLAYGCNIGAYFSGIASGSLHGWCWLVAAFVGNILGTQLRPLFGLAVEREPTANAKR